MPMHLAMHLEGAWAKNSEKIKEKKKNKYLKKMS